MIEIDEIQPIFDVNRFSFSTGNNGCISTNKHLLQFSGVCVTARVRELDSLITFFRFLKP